MKPVRFAEQNGDLLKPPTMTDEECQSLPCYRDGQEVISCWRPTWQERLSVLVHGRVWLRVLSGWSQPPVSLTAARVLFEPAEARDRSWWRRALARLRRGEEGR